MNWRRLALVCVLVVATRSAGDAIVVTRAMQTSTVADVEVFGNLLPDPLHGEIGLDNEPLAERLPVMDFRYLGGQETLDLDWDDAWYSKFRNGTSTGSSPRRRRDSSTSIPSRFARRSSSVPATCSYGSTWGCSSMAHMAISSRRMRRMPSQYAAATATP